MLLPILIEKKSTPAPFIREPPPPPHAGKVTVIVLLAYILWFNFILASNFIFLSFGVW